MVRIRQPNPTHSARIERAAHLSYIEGATEAEIADAVGIKPVTVRDWKKRPEWIAAIAELRAIQFENASQRLVMLTAKAVSAVEQTLVCDNDALRFRAAVWLLERPDHFIDANAIASNDQSGMVERFVKRVTGDGEVPNGD